MKDKKYVVYITHYKGDKLPPWYIGSSNKEKVMNGYNGSVKSKKYSTIYKNEQKLNKHLFRTKIVSYHKTRDEALKEEYRLQMLHNVKTNDKYINESVAAKDGFFGRDVSGELNPNSGVRWDNKQKENLSEITKGCKYYNNGILVKRVYETEIPPKGWVKGHLYKSSKDKYWINNSKEEKYIPKEDTVPEGWIKGRINKSCEGKMAINNGTISKFILKNEKIPEGWIKGPIKYLCKYCNKYFDKGNFSYKHGEKCKLKDKR